MDEEQAKGGVIGVLREYPLAQECLKALHRQQLPDAWIGGGFVRNAVWDKLHGHQFFTPVNDIDVIYFDPKDLSKEQEEAIEGRLGQSLPNLPWSVKNQARMHLHNNHPPYKNSSEAMSRWVETATAVGAKLNDNQEIEVLAPLGLEDLLTLVLRPTPTFAHRPETFVIRVEEKGWLTTWPRLKVAD